MAQRYEQIPNLANFFGFFYRSRVICMALLCHHKRFVFRGYTLFIERYGVRIMCNYGANIRIIPETCKHFGNYFDYGDGDRGGSDHPWPLLT